METVDDSLENFLSGTCENSLVKEASFNNNNIEEAESLFTTTLIKPSQTDQTAGIHRDGGSQRLSYHPTTPTSVIYPVTIPEHSLAPFISDSSIPVPHIQNIIASVHLAQELDLRSIAISARNAEYNPRKVNAVVMRLRDPKCTGLVFRSGRMMITGARAEEDAKLGGKKMAKICQKAGHEDVKFCGFKIENMIATADCCFPIRLEGLAYDHREYSSYEPEMFPGLVYRYNPHDNSKAVLLLFVSGKVIITGCKSRREIATVFESIYPVLCQYRK